MKKAIIALCLLMSYTCISAQAKSMKEHEKEKNKNDKGKDNKFVEHAAEGGMMEVQLGQLAEKNGGSEKVKALGRQMVEDHSKANEELKSIISGKYNAPENSGKKGREEYEKLSRKTGEEFDKAYTKLMVKDHKEDIALFKKEAKDGDDPGLKKFAEKTLPTLEHHLKMAEEARDVVKETKKEK